MEGPLANFLCSVNAQNLSGLRVCGAGGAGGRGEVRGGEHDAG